MYARWTIRSLIGPSLEVETIYAERHSLANEPVPAEFLFNVRRDVRADRRENVTSVCEIDLQAEGL